MPRLLLVDDDDSFRTMLRITLVKMGHVVHEARNGREAMAAYEREPLDLVITDLVMPEQEGVETIRKLRHKYPEVKIIAMSGGGRSSATAYLKIAKAMGADLVLAKPFSNDEMRAGIEQLMAGDGSINSPPGS
jgi:CheY-like chemotaxis protein